MKEVEAYQHSATRSNHLVVVSVVFLSVGITALAFGDGGDWRPLVLAVGATLFAYIFLGNAKARHEEGYCRRLFSWWGVLPDHPPLDGWRDALEEAGEFPWQQEDSVAHRNGLAEGNNE